MNKDSLAGDSSERRIGTKGVLFEETPDAGARCRVIDCELSSAEESVSNRATHSEHSQISLAAESSQYDRPDVGRSRGRRRDSERRLGLLDGFPAQSSHLVVFVKFSGESFGVGIVSECGDERVGDHDGFEMEPPVSDVTGKRTD